MLGGVSAEVAVPGRGGSCSTVLLMAELAVLATITADFASRVERRRVIARVIVASAVGTVALGALGVVLFYAGPGALPGSHPGTLVRAHFTPLQVAATVGLPALAALIAMLWLLWRS